MSNRDSIASTTGTSRFSHLLTPTSNGSSGGGGGGQIPLPSSSSSATTLAANTSGAPSTSPSSTTGGGGATTTSATTATPIRRGTVIYDRPLTKSRQAEVSLSAWQYLFGELVQHEQRLVTGIAEFERKLHDVGYRVGTRVVELLSCRDALYPLQSSSALTTLSRGPPAPTRHVRLLQALTWVHSNVYRYLFGRPADSLERSTEHDDEYMIGDDDMVVTRSIVVPKDMNELSCAAFVAGIVEAAMDQTGFPSRVTAHSVPTSQHPRRTVLLIKLDPLVLQREQALSAPAS
ncbi:hypothetical protein JCM3766R1_006489 [Sporobolomyces carnicolor]